MNDLEKELKLQALIDGELPPDEAKQANDWLARDADAQALFNELKSTKAALAGNEPELKLPEAPEFYWSKISRQIETEARALEREESTSASFSWRRWLMPLAATVSLALILIVTLKLSLGSRLRLATADAFEPPHEDSSIISFRSESEGISVVWVATR